MRQRVLTGSHMLIASLLSGGCGDRSLEPICTEIGCSSGLTVHLPAIPSGTFKVEVLVTGVSPGNPDYQYECNGGAGCQQHVFFPNLEPGQVSIRVTTTAGTRTTPVTSVTYVETRPNGPDCPPLCRQGSVTAELPS